MLESSYTGRACLVRTKKLHNISFVNLFIIYFPIFALSFPFYWTGSSEKCFCLLLSFALAGLFESFDNSITNSATEINYVFIHRTVGNSETPEGQVEIQGTLKGEGLTFIPVKRLACHVSTTENTILV